MSSNHTPHADLSGDEIGQTGKQFGYGNWLQPIINANDQSASESTVENQPTHTPASTRRGRGRPRVTGLRNESAIEKRRAQVREAQRTYQKRKDTATATEKRRVDELLQVLSDLSSDVEALLEVSSKAGAMRRDDEISKHIQRLWTSYDAAINNTSVTPELRLFQIKNSRRVASHHSNQNFIVAARTDTPTEPQSNTETTPPSIEPSAPFDPSDMSFELVRFQETTVMQPFQRTVLLNGSMAGQSIFEIVKERQRAMKEADKAASGS